MSEFIGVFLENLFPENILLVYFMGVLLSIAETRGVRTSLYKGVKFAFALFFAAFLGFIIADAIPLEFEFFHPWIFLLTSLAAVFILQLSGELKGEFYGVPRLLLPLVLFVGTQYILVGRGLSFEMMVVSALANSLGFYLGFILIGTIKEQMIISEADDIFKYSPVLLISLGVLSMAVMGFAFLY